jgi:tetratricopeptide (TPR) repeat protein
VKNGKRIWAKEYSSLRQDLLTAQNTICSELVSALDLKDEDPTRGALRLTGNYSAYELYMKGRDVVRRQPNAKGYSEALNFYDEAIGKDPRFALAYAARADTSLALYLLTKEKSWAQKALSDAEHAKQLNTDLPEVHWALGSVYLQTGQREASIEEMKLALQLAPNSDESYRRLGTVYLAVGRTDAIAAYEKAAEINPYYWYNFNWLGVSCFRLGEVDKALNAFRRVTELAPDWAPGYNNLGAAYYQQGMWSEAVAAYRKSLSLDPSGGDAHANLGTAFYYLGMYRDAAKALEKAVQLDPSSHENIAGLADAYLQLGQRDNAMSTYDTAIRLALKAYQVNPGEAITLGELALYYAKKGELNRAQNFIAKAREIDANNNLLIYNDAMIHALSGKPAEALSLLREAFKNGFPVGMARSEPELAALRSSAEFEKLMKDFSR